MVNGRNPDDYEYTSEQEEYDRDRWLEDKYMEIYEKDNKNNTISNRLPPSAGGDYPNESSNNTELPNEEEEIVDEVYNKYRENANDSKRRGE